MESKDRVQHDLLQAVKALAVELDRTPSRAEFRAKVRGADGRMMFAFGGFVPLLHAAGLRPGERANAAKPQGNPLSKFKYKPTKIESFVIYKILLDELFERAGNPEVFKLLAMGDVHAECVDEAALGAYLAFAKFYRAHGHLIIGDFLNVASLSHWGPESLKPQRFAPEALRGRSILDRCAKAMPDLVWRGYCEGNHEDWIRQAFIARMPEYFDGIEELGGHSDLNGFLGLDKRGYQLFPLNTFVEIGKANFTHGLYTSANHPKKHLDELKDSVFYGHLHDDNSANATSLRGVLRAQSIGCLCRLDAKFLKGKPNNWVHTVPIFEFRRDGSFTHTVHRITNGVMSYNGVLFKADE